MYDDMKHYGILGMRWGRRKQVSDDYSRAKAIKKKKVSSLSDEDIDFATERMALVKKFHETTSTVNVKGSEGRARFKSNADLKRDIERTNLVDHYERHVGPLRSLLSGRKFKKFDNNQIKGEIAKSVLKKRGDTRDVSKMSQDEIDKVVERDMMTRKFKDLKNERRNAVIAALLVTALYAAPEAAKRLGK